MQHLARLVVAVRFSWCALIVPVGMFLLSGCASSAVPTANTGIAAPVSTGAVSDFVETNTLVDKNSGLLIVGVRAYAMNNADRVSNEAAVFNGISVKNLDTGAIYRIPMRGDTAVKVLPKGSYCLNSFRFYINVDVEYCQGPDFMISSGEALNAGYVLVGVNYRGPSRSTRIWPYDMFRHWTELLKNLTDVERGEVKSFIGNVEPNRATLDNTIWYNYDFAGLPHNLIFGGHGDFQFESTPLRGANTRHHGTWKVGVDRVTFTDNDTSRTFEGTIKGDVMCGMAHAKDGSTWVWYATRDPSVLLPLNSGPTARMLYQDSGIYPPEALQKGITGSVQVHFNLPLPKPGTYGTPLVSYPTDVKVVHSEPSGIFDDAAMDAIQAASYANAVVGGKEVPSDADETITFKIVDGKPVIGYATKIEPWIVDVPAPSSKH